MKKKILTMLIFTMMLFAFSCVCASDITEIIGGGEIGPKPVDGEFAAMILGVMQWAGYAIAIGMVVYIGIKYIMASPDDKAELKNAMVKYLIGAFLIVGASSIASWIFNAI